MSLTKSLRWEIQTLGQRLSAAANAEEQFQRSKTKVKDHAQHALELQRIAQAIRRLLTRIEDAVPLINLAITASGASLSSTLPSTVSPSRLLQASTFLTAGDSQYSGSPAPFVQIGPTFILSMYMLFQGHIRPENEEDVRESTWKEVIHKAVVRLIRVPIDNLYSLPDPLAAHDDRDSLDSDSNHVTRRSCQGGPHHSERIPHNAKNDEYAYQIVIIEDLNDDRLHNFDEDEAQPDRYGDIELAGIREPIPIHELSKIFYADTGKILNIGSDGEANSPVLLLKRDPNAIAPRRMVNKYGVEEDTNQSDASGSPAAVRLRPENASVSTKAPPSGSWESQSYPERWRLPPYLDPEWMAFEVYTEVEDSDSESENEDPSLKAHKNSRASSLDPQMTSKLSRLDLGSSPVASPSPNPSRFGSEQPWVSSLPPIRTSLSLLETLLRLISLQQFQQTPHLSIPDELLTFFLSEAASTGAASNDGQERKRLREEARRRVGFDPYDESPVKRRGEEYQYTRFDREGSERGDEIERSYTDERSQSPLTSSERRYEDEGYGTYKVRYPPGTITPSLPATPQDRKTPGTPTSQTTDYEISSERRSPSGFSKPKGRPPPLTRRRDGGRYGLRDNAAAAGRKGSPLARPGTELTDEGLGTSPPSSAGTGQHKESS